MTNIETQAKTAFGKTLHYVTDPVYADALTRLTGKKTINDLDIINLQMLGLQVNGVNAIAQLELAVQLGVSHMNHQRFKFYHHSTDYYKQLHDSITHLEQNCKEVTYTVLPSTINTKRTSKFIKSNSNTFKSHNKVG